MQNITDCLDWQELNPVTRISKFIVGGLLTVILAFATKTKKIKCCCGCCGVAVPVKFLEDKENRLVILSVFTLASSELFNVLFGDEYDNLQKDMGPYEKQFLKLGLMQLYSIMFMPLLVTATTSGSVFHSLVGLANVLFFSATLIMSEFLLCQKEEDLSNDVPALLFTCLSLIACCILVVKYFSNLCQSLKRNNAVSSCKLAKSSYHVIYVRQLLNTNNNTKKLKGKSQRENFFSRHIYKNIEGFRYSISFQLSIYVGSVIVFALSVTYYIVAYDIYDGLNGGMREWLLSTSYSPDESATKGSVILSITVSLLIIAMSILLMAKNYRQNVLDMSHNIKNKYLLNLDDGNISNVNIIVNSLCFSGYQAAHIIWGFHIQFLVFLLASIIAGEIIIIPFIISFVDFFLAIMEYIGPILLVLVLTIVIQWLLVRFFFVQEKGKVLALDNRRCFYNVMYYMFFYNILTGVLTSLIRLGKSIVFNTLIVPRLDHSLFPTMFERFDSGFKAYACILKMEALQSNSILIVFIAIVNGRISARRKQNCRTPTYAKKILRRKAIAKHRWFLAWTLFHNDVLVYTRKSKKKMPTVCY